MPKLNGDVLYLILQELYNNKKTLYSYLLVNKTCCEIIIPILWKDPWKFLKYGKEKSLLNVIISHLPNELGKNFLANSYSKPSFDYISFCKHLNLNVIQKIIERSKINVKTIEFEIINLFINENTNFTHLYIPQRLDYQIHGAESCFSKIEFLSCNTSINCDVLASLVEISKSIKKLELCIELQNNNYQIVRLIEAPNKLLSVRFLANYTSYVHHDEFFYRILENSLIKRANTIQYFSINKPPVTKLLSSFVNLRTLELNGNYLEEINHLVNLTLPLLQILIAIFVPINVLTSLIENTSGYLVEVSITCINNIDDYSNKIIIQVIYQNCPKLEYLKLAIKSKNVLELEKLLINCQYLNELYLIINEVLFYFDDLFKVLAKSSPTSLFRFKFDFKEIKLEPLKLFFDSWRGRRPMLLQIISCSTNNSYLNLIEKYKARRVIENYGKDRFDYFVN